MRILLIAPPYALEEYPLPPLSLSYLSGSLLEHGFEVEILDLLTSKASPAKIRRKLEQYQPQVVGTTAVTMTFPAASRILKACKEFDPGITTVVGGPHVSFAAEDTFQRAPWIDVVVAGEGDMTVVELASALDRGADIEKVAGLFINRNGKVIKTAPRPLIDNLDELPLPARHLLPLSRYHALGAACSVISSRGCPYGCTFCTTPRMYGRKVRFRQPALVVDEIELIYREYGFSQISVVDDTFTLNHPHATDLCRELIRRRLPVKWSIFSRVDTLTPELLDLMREAGCTCMLFGVESGNQEVLNNIKKGITPEKVKTGVRMATEAGIGTFASFILGLPGETPERSRETHGSGDGAVRTLGHPVRVSLSFAIPRYRAVRESQGVGNSFPDQELEPLQCQRTDHGGFGRWSRRGQRGCGPLRRGHCPGLGNHPQRRCGGRRRQH